MKECNCDSMDLNKYHSGEDRVCWLLCRKELTYAHNREGPGLWQQAKNLTSETIKFLLKGAPLVSDKEYQNRIGLGGCKDCDKAIHEEDNHITCNICGCNMSIKAHMATAQCPHPSGSRWPVNAYSDNKSNWAPPCGGCGRH
jgi:hypothetical protein